MNKAVLESLRVAVDTVTPQTRAAYLLDAGRPQEAFDVLVPALAANPDDAGSLVLSAIASLELDDAQQSFAIACQAIDAAPGLDAAWRIASSSAAALGRMDLARQCARVAVDLEPAEWANHLLVAGVGLATGTVDAETFAAAREAVHLAPDEAHAHVTLAAVWAGKHKSIRARASARRALRLDPQNAAARSIESMMTGAVAALA